MLLLVIVLSGCTRVEKNEEALFELVDPEASGIQFTNTVENRKGFNIFNYRNFYNGGGVAIGDINNDGLADLYLTHNTESNRLFLNKGNFQFEDVTEQSGTGGKRAWSTGVVFVDINSDGLLDIYVCNAGYVQGDDQENELFINNGDLTFTESASQYNLNNNGYTTHAGFFDYDMDGDLDVYILNNSFMPVNTLNYANKRELKAEEWPVKDFLKGGGDKLLRNDDGLFTDVTEDAGIYSSLIGFGLGITIGDVNADGWPDMYISNDFFERDYLYINNQDGTFTEDIKNWMAHLSQFSMGADMADINNDGKPEIFVTDMMPDNDQRLKRTSSFDSYSVYEMKLNRDFYYQYMHNTLQLNNGDGTFSEIAHFSGVEASDWSWGALIFDMDNDGLRDIYVCNGIYQDVTDQDFIDFFANEIIQRMVITGVKDDIDSVLKHMPSTPLVNKAFRNEGNLKFSDNSEAWGFNKPSYSNGAAYGDLDNDGDLDLVINNLNQETFVYRNTSDTSGNHSISLLLKGKDGNTFAIGSRVFIHVGDEVIFSEVIPSRGFQSSIDYRTVFGLGNHEVIDSAVIIWPDMTRSTILDPATDTLHVIEYSAITRVPTKEKEAGHDDGRFFSQVNSPFGEVAEDNYVDFYNEGLLMKKLSNEGPALAVGDMNGDGMDDVFIGGAVNQPGTVYIQRDGSFTEQPNDAFRINGDFEDTAAALADVDSDGDLDLYVGSGGNHVPQGVRNLHDRLYLNNGNGEFTLATKALPVNGSNTAFVIPHDINSDGAIDLIVGSRSVTNNYGVDPPNYVFINDGTGVFSDQTNSMAGDFQTCGMLTDGLVTDLLEPGKDVLVVVGEWMAPTVFSIEDGTLRKTQTSLTSQEGWWYAIKASDLDGDGDTDLVMGNLGENFYLDTSEDEPVRLWLSDFDGNGTVENIVTRSIDGKDMPVPLKKELTAQITSLKKLNLKHEDYSTKSIQDLFAPTVLNRATVKKATTFQSVIAWNEGGGSFTIAPLPLEVQLSCVCDISCLDIDSDGKDDIVLGGNDYGFVPQFSRQDASFGNVVINNGDRNLHRLKPADSGFFVRGQVRKISTITIDGEPYLFVALSNEKPRLFKVNQSTGL